MSLEKIKEVEVPNYEMLRLEEGMNEGGGVLRVGVGTGAGPSSTVGFAQK